MLTTVSAPDATLVVIYADSLRWHFSDRKAQGKVR